MIVHSKDLAMGLHMPERRRAYFFADFRVGSRPKRMIAIGRGNYCDISLDDPFASVVHAVLKRDKDGAMWLHNRSETNGILVGETLLEDSIALVVGMEIRLGHTLFVATDKDGRFPIGATTVSDLCRKAATLYGSFRLAGRQVGRSHKFVARQHIPREERYEGSKTSTSTLDRTAKSKTDAKTTVETAKKAKKDDE